MRTRSLRWCADRPCGVKHDPCHGARTSRLTVHALVYNHVDMELRGYAEDTSGRLDATFLALADPTRRAILARLAMGEASVTELAAPFTMSQPAISKHLKVLERAGLVSRHRDAQRRPCRLEASALREATEWLEAYRRFWAEQYERLDDLLAELQTTPQEGPDR